MVQLTCIFEAEDHICRIGNFDLKMDQINREKNDIIEWVENLSRNDINDAVKLPTISRVNNAYNNLIKKLNEIRNIETHTYYDCLDVYYGYERAFFDYDFILKVIQFDFNMDR